MSLPLSVLKIFMIVLFYDIDNVILLIYFYDIEVIISLFVR